MENKFAKIPVASHGIHKHRYNYPWLSSICFGDVMPCYINTLRKGERDNPKAGVFSQLMPIAHNAFATGRFNFKAIFVPYKLVWRPWYSFDQQTDYYSNGSASKPTRYPYTTHGDIVAALISNSYLITTGASSTNYDVDVFDTTTLTSTYYLATDTGRRILRILGALGCMPSFISGDKTTINILPIMCYIKAYADYYFPNNYVGNTSYNYLTRFFDTDVIDFTQITNELVIALDVCSLNYYENSIFDLAWDNPVSPNVNSTSPSVAIKDITNNAMLGSSSTQQVVTNDPNVAQSPNSSSYKPSNGTPFAGGSFGSSSTGVSYAVGVVTNYVIESLKSLTMWVKRHQIAGARVLERFLVSRGIELPSDSARMSYYLGMRNIEIEVSGVENNTDTNLGELAGRGVASSGNSPLSFECRPDDDGIFLVIVSPIPDANFPVLLDGFACRSDYMDNYNAEFDKLGAAAVPSSVIRQGVIGSDNYTLSTSVFGFLSQYWDEIQERPRLLGDFILPSRGANELQAYHTFRRIGANSGAYHSFQFIRMIDAGQYQRLFYSDKQENLMLFLRWYGDQYKEKLPLGDSYDWDDDELNRRVSVVVGGSQK